MLVMLAMVSLIAYAIIELPPGDYVTVYLNSLRSRGTEVDQSQYAALRKQYSLDRPVYYRYFKWVQGLLRGNLGRSLRENRQVEVLIAKRLPHTVLISMLALVITYSIVFPIGVFSAVRQYSIGDHFFTGVSFAGMAIPNFLLALFLMYFTFKVFHFNPIGLNSIEFTTADFSFSKLLDTIKHLPVPLIVVCAPGSASLIRVMRACLLDELKKQYVTTARAKGLVERRLLFRYPIRVAVNPVISTIGWILPGIFSGSAIAAIVLDLPTIGNMLYQALLSQDTYTAGSIIIILSFLTLLGTLISDILLVVVDPRIRFEKI